MHAAKDGSMKSTATQRSAEAGTAKSESAAYLQALGERVRATRARRGMTRKILSRDSGVSERYLAELESGRGNASITILRQIADAMNLPIADLVREGAEPSAELALIIERLGRLSKVEMEAAGTLLSEHFPAAEARRERIALVGLRGAGKSSLGQALGVKLGVPFLEMAQEIERDAGVSLPEIFDLWGQPAYRRHERRTLERIIEEHDRAVIATGGSIVSEPSTYEYLLDTCYVIWVQADPEEHMERVRAQGDYRPMADNREAMEDLRRILAGREEMYQRADTILQTSGQDLERSAADLLALARAAQSNMPNSA
jgi:XRE family aerobic/anaerobic benzoate catabolism transcriptional regulator